MTENEALRYIILFRDEWDKNSKTKNAEALDVAIKSLEEIQQYRAIGTVEECIDAVMNIERFCMIGRNKGIDELAERLKDKAEEMLKNPDIIAECKKCIIWTVKNIDDIAEQLKGEKDNEEN